MSQPGLPLSPSMDQAALTAARNAAEALIEQLATLQTHALVYLCMDHRGDDWDYLASAQMRRLASSVDAVTVQVESAESVITQDAVRAFELAAATELPVLRYANREAASAYEVLMEGASDGLFWARETLNCIDAPAMLQASNLLFRASKRHTLFATSKIEELRPRILKEWAIASKLCDAVRTPQSTIEAIKPPSCRPAAQVRPHWNAKTGEFKYGDRRCTVAVQASLVRQLLDAFTSEGWAEQIDSPFLGPDDHHRALKAVRKKKVVHFVSAQNGHGIAWKSEK